VYAISFPLIPNSKIPIQSSPAKRSESTSFVTFSIHIVTFLGEIGTKGEEAKAEIKFDVSRKPPERSESCNS